VRRIEILITAASASAEDEYAAEQEVRLAVTEAADRIERSTSCSVGVRDDRPEVVISDRWNGWAILSACAETAKREGWPRERIWRWLRQALAHGADLAALHAHVVKTFEVRESIEALSTSTESFEGFSLREEAAG
jgi:hypothetical protein